MKKKKLSVRTVEEIVKKLKEGGKKETKKPEKTKSSEIITVENDLRA